MDLAASRRRMDHLWRLSLDTGEQRKRGSFLSVAPARFFDLVWACSHFLVSSLLSSILQTYSLPSISFRLGAGALDQGLDHSPDNLLPGVASRRPQVTPSETPFPIILQILSSFPSHCLPVTRFPHSTYLKLYFYLLVVCFPPIEDELCKQRSFYVDVGSPACAEWINKGPGHSRTMTSLWPGPPGFARSWVLFSE